MEKDVCWRSGYRNLNYRVVLQVTEFIENIEKAGGVFISLLFFYDDYNNKLVNIKKRRG